MSLARRLLLTLVLACAATAPAHAALIIDVAMTPINMLGTPFGIGALPAGPFSARFTLAEPLPANFEGGLEVENFVATVGNQTWELDDLAIERDDVLHDIIVFTDAAGAITGFAASAREGDNDLSILLFPGQGGAAFGAREGSFCEDPAISACMEGIATISTRLAEVPEPAALALFLAGLAGIVATRRQSQRTA
jgi:hypothetical protein